MSRKPFWTVEQVEQKSKELGRKIAQSGYKPDFVVGIKFGGHIVGTHVAQGLGVPYHSISVKRRLSETVARFPSLFRRFRRLHGFFEDLYYKLSRPFVAEPLGLRLNENHKVLLVDDDVILSRTINAAKAHLVKMGALPENIVVASLNAHPKLKKKPDFFVESVDAVFPWSTNSPYYEEFKKTRYAKDF